MSLRKISNRALLFSSVLFSFVPPLSAEAQDVDVQGNLTMHDSADATVGNVLKEGVPFLHNFGVSNTFLGSGAGNFTMTEPENTAVGGDALRNNDTGAANTATGFGALGSNEAGSRNTATGRTALFSNTSGTENTAIGGSALFFNTTGNYNTASGSNALQSNTTGSENTASGAGALSSNTTGGGNTAGGFNALSSNITGGANTASGFNALSFNTTGSYNTASGVGALVNNSTGIQNTATGVGTLSGNTTGDNNTAIGFFANVATGNLANATAIGWGAVVDASNKIRLGNVLVTVIEGQVPYTYTSDRSQKENLHPVEGEEVLTKIRGLSLTSWNYIGQDAKQFRHYGPMAQDFFAAFGHDAVGTIGTPTTITSGDLDGILMIAVQALEKRTVEQEKEIAQLKARLAALERGVGREVATEARAGF
jgi:trimeric autotransporter adhesin